MFEVPTSLSPSRVEKFTSCPMAFRFASIEKLPEPPSLHTTRGSIVHRALELGFLHPPTERTAERFHRCLDAALAEFALLPDLQLLALDDAAAAELAGECRTLVDNYLRMIRFYVRLLQNLG